MIRVTYVMGCHDSRYSQHFRNGDIDQATDLVDTNMAKEFFRIEVAGGFIRIYPSKVSAIEIRDITHEENIRAEALKAQREGA